MEQVFSAVTGSASESAPAAYLDSGTHVLQRLMQNAGILKFVIRVVLLRDKSLRSIEQFLKTDYSVILVARYASALDLTLTDAVRHGFN